MRAGRSQNKRLLCMHPTRWKKCPGGQWRLFWGTSCSKGIKPTPISKRLHLPHSPWTFHHHQHHQQQQQKSTFRKCVWSEQCRKKPDSENGRCTYKKLKKEEEKTFHCSYWFADAEATANQMGMCVCFFRNPDAWRRRRRFLWWIKKHLKRRRRRRRSPVSETLCVCACFFYPESFWDLPRETKIPDWQNCTYLTHVGPRSRGSSRFWTTPSRLSRSQRVGACIALHWPQGCQHRSVLVRIIQKLIIPSPQLPAGKLMLLVLLLVRKSFCHQHDHHPRTCLFSEWMRCRPLSLSLSAHMPL